MRCSIVHVQDSDYPGDPSGAYPNRAQKNIRVFDCRLWAAEGQPRRPRGCVQFLTVGSGLPKVTSGLSIIEGNWAKPRNNSNNNNNKAAPKKLSSSDNPTDRNL